MHKIGIIGDFESVCGFLSAGFDICPVSSKKEAKEKLQDMVKRNYGIIFMTSEYFFEINSKNTSVIPLPDKNSNIGTERIWRFTEKAAGSRI